MILCSNAHQNKLNYLLLVKNLNSNAENRNKNQMLISNSSNLLIEKKFVDFLNNYLPADKPIFQKQNDINRLIKTTDNVYQLIFMYDNYNKIFSPQNFFNFVMKLNKLSLSNSNIPLNQIKNSLLKSILKHGPEFNGQDCKKVLLYFNDNGILLDEPICKSLVMLLRYHLNELELNDLIDLKIIVNKYNKEFSSNKKIDYIDSFEKSLNLTVQLKCNKISDIHQAFNILIYFGSTLNSVDYQKILIYLSKSTEKFSISLTTLANLIEIICQNRPNSLAKLILERAMDSIDEHKNMINKYKKMCISDTTSTDFNKKMYFYQLFNRIMKTSNEKPGLISLKKFDNIINYQLKFVEDLDQKDLKNNDLVIESIHVLLNFFILKRYKSYEAVQLILNKFFNSNYEFINNEKNFPVAELIYYIGLTKFDRLIFFYELKLYFSIFN